MAKKLGEGTALVYGAAETFVDRALRREDSLFTPGVAIWTERTAEDLHKRFVEHPDTSGDTFEQKFNRQLAGAPPETIQLAAEMLYAHFLIVSPKQVKGSTKRKRIQAVLSWSRKSVEIPTELADALDHGICHAGQAFGQYRPQQLWFLVKFVVEWKHKTDEERRGALSDPWVFKNIVFSVPAQSARLQQNALLHLVHPQTFEPTVSDEHKQRIVARFATADERTEPDIDRQLIRIRERLSQQYGEGFTFYSDQIRRLWDTEEDTEDDGGSDEDSSHTLRYWVEKTRVSGRPDREHGPHSLGHALWSPQLTEDGRAYYRAMRDVKPGDVVFHLIALGLRPV